MKRIPPAQHRLIRDIVLCGSSQHRTRYRTYRALEQRGYMVLSATRWAPTDVARTYVDTCEREDIASISR